MIEKKELDISNRYDIASKFVDRVCNGIELLDEPVYCDFIQTEKECNDFFNKTRNKDIALLVVSWHNIKSGSQLIVSINGFKIESLLEEWSLIGREHPQFKTVRNDVSAVLSKVIPDMVKISEEEAQRKLESETAFSLGKLLDSMDK